MHQSIVNENSQAAALREAWQEIAEDKPGIRIREAARFLNSSEAQLLATTIGEQCIRLKPDWHNLLQQWKTLGHVMSLTRNDACILEHKGPFQKINIFGEGDKSMATVIGPIETRVFFKNWHVAFAVKQEKRGRLLQSIQVFDKAGDAVTKIYLEAKSNQEAFNQLIQDFRSDDQSPEQELAPVADDVYSETIDAKAFLSDWDELQDTHDFFPMLRKHNVDRYQAVELAVEKYTYQVKTESIQQLLEQAAATKLPIMIFAGNRGNLQIHQGKVRTIRLLERGHTGDERWLNVLDPAFNMHLRLDLVAFAWVVKKPTSDGIVTAIELFDQDKKLVTQFFGLRKPGIPQKAEWQELVASLPKL